MVSMPLSGRIDDTSPMALQVLPWVREGNGGKTDDVFGRLYPEAAEGMCAVALVRYDAKEQEILHCKGVGRVMVDGSVVDGPLSVGKGGIRYFSSPKDPGCDGASPYVGKERFPTPCFRINAV